MTYGYTGHEWAQKLDQLAQLQQQIRDLEAERDALVVDCRMPELGRYVGYGQPSWVEVGKALGVTKQAAQRKYQPMVEAQRDERRRDIEAKCARGQHLPMKNYEWKYDEEHNWIRHSRTVCRWCNEWLSGLTPDP